MDEGNAALAACLIETCSGTGKLDGHGGSLGVKIALD